MEKVRKILNGRVIKHKGWRRAAKITIIVFAVIALITMFLSPILKYLVEKYDTKYTGREITMSSAYVNPFTGYFHFNNFRMYEQNSDSVFLYSKRLAVRFDLTKFFTKTYEIRSIELRQPTGVIIQDSSHFNFTDLIQKFSSDTLVEKDTADVVHINLFNIEITNGTFRYVEKITPVDYTIIDTYLKTDAIRWNSDTISIKYAFRPQNAKGSIEGQFIINSANDDFSLAARAKELDMGIFEQYMSAFAKRVRFTSSLDADIRATGNFKNSDALNAKGTVALNDMRLGEKNKKEDYASFERLKVDIVELSPGEKKYEFDSVVLAKPYVNLEVYDTTHDNFTILFGTKSAGATDHHVNLILIIGDFIVDIFKNFLQSQYRVNMLAIQDGNADYSDYSLAERFGVSLDSLNLSTDSVNDKHNVVGLKLHTDIKPYGSFDALVRVSGKENKDFDLNYNLRNISAAMFNPYIVTYTSYPLDRGAIEMNGHWRVRDNVISSNNHFVMIDPRVGKRIKKKDNSWLPMPLILALVRENGEVIDYEIPITGNLKNPHFHLHDAVWDMIRNIFVKPPATPYRLEVRSAERKIEKALLFKWHLHQVKLSHEQESFVKDIADFLKDNKEASITVRPITYADKEKEYMLFYEAKKRYYMSQNKIESKDFDEKDSIAIEAMSTKDSSFIKYLEARVKDRTLHSVQEKCARLIGAQNLNAKLKQLNKDRQAEFLSYFKDAANRVHFTANENRIPFNGYSFFKIEYKGEIPEDLQKAYDELDEYNRQGPRAKYQQYRKSKLERLFKRS